MPLSKEDVKVWMTRIENAKKYQREFGNQHDRWELNRAAMAGDFQESGVPEDERVDVNYTRPTIDTMLSPFWITDPMITVNPTTKNAVMSDGTVISNVINAENTEAEVNYWFRELKFKRELKKCILDSEAFNLAYAIVGYHKNKDNLEQGGERIEARLHESSKKPFIRRVSPKNVLLPRGHYDFEDHPWVCIVYHWALKDAKKRFGRRASDLKATASLDPKKDDGTEIDNQLRKSGQENEEDIVYLYEVWCKRTMKRYVLAQDHDTYLEETDWPVKSLEGFPLRAMRAVDVPDDYHGTPPMSYWQPQQHEVIKARSAAAWRENRRKANVFVSGDIDDDVMEAYQQARDSEMVKLPITDEDIRRKMVFEDGLPPADAEYAYGQRQLQDLFFISGMGPQQRSQGDPNAPTATASANIEKWALVRQTNRGDVIRSFVLDIAETLWKTLKTFPNEQRDRLVLGPRGEIFKELRYSIKDLEGRFHFELDMSAMLAENPATRSTRAIALYQLFRPDPRVNPDPLIRDVLVTQGIRDPETYILDLKSPEEEFQLMQTNIPVEAQLRDDHVVHMGAHQSHLQQLEGALDQLGDPQSTMGVRIRGTIFLVMAHINHHAKFIQEITGKPLGGSPEGGTGSSQPGQPRDQNTFRQALAAEDQNEQETPAELSGQPQQAGI